MFFYTCTITQLLVLFLVIERPYSAFSQSRYRQDHYTAKVGYVLSQSSVPLFSLQ